MAVLTLEDLVQRKYANGDAPTACPMFLRRLHYLQAAMMSAHQEGESAILQAILEKYRRSGYLSAQGMGWIEEKLTSYGV